MLGEDWFQVGCWSCSAQLSLAPGQDLADLIELMGWQETDRGFSCEDCVNVPF